MTNATLNIALANTTTSSAVYAYVTGISTSGSFILMQADGVTPYYPTSPSSTGQPLAVDCGILLGAPGTSRTVTIPRISGGRIYFCIDSTLTFLLNPGPGLVEPSVANSSDPNYSKNWGFCEFTFNDYQIYANISYVDFVALPIALSLSNTSGAVQSVTGIPKAGLQSVANALVTQHNADGAGWDQLVVKTASGTVLRCLSPNTGIVMNSSLFNGYYQSYVDQIFTTYATKSLSVDTQASWGVLSATVANGQLVFSDGSTFGKPAASDVFSCSTGPFANVTGSGVVGNLGARLAAGFNRSVMGQTTQPATGAFYQNPITNHYSRILHSVNGDGRGYAFPYDDVLASNATAGDQSGSVYDSNPVLLTVTIGGY